MTGRAANPAAAGGDPAVPLVEFRGVSKAYRLASLEVPVLHGIDVRIAPGEFTAIMGASGSGKSTMMNIIGFLDRPTAGEYRFKGRDVTALDDDEESHIRNREIGFIYQNFNLLPRCTAFENVAVPLFYRPEVPDVNAAVQRAVDVVGLGDRMHHRPNELSGGQRQRVAIARAIVGNPSILLADEPTGALDSRTGEEIMALFRDLHRTGCTIVTVTHDSNVAAHCERVIRIKDGRITEDSGR